MIYIPAYHIPVHSDDYWYYYRGTSFLSHWHHYMSWSGRFSVDYISALLLNLFDRPIYMAINSMALLVLLVNFSLIPSLMNGVNSITKNHSIILWFSFFMYWLCNPNLGQTSFWLVGSVNYLWPLMWLSSYMASFFKLLNDGSYTYKNLFFLCVLGFFAGLSNEATGASTVFFTILFFFVHPKVKWKKSLRAFSFSSGSIPKNINIIFAAGFLSSLAGFILLVLAPGNYIRLSKEFPDWLHMPFVDKVLLHLTWRIPVAIGQFWFGFSIIGILILVLTCVIYNSEKIKIIVYNCYIISMSLLGISTLSTLLYDEKWQSEIFIVILLLLIIINIVIVFSFLIIYWFNNTEVISLSDIWFYKNTALFFIMAEFSIFVYIVSPYVPPRALNTFNFYIVLAIVVLVEGVLCYSLRYKNIHNYVLFLFILCVPLFLFSYFRFTYAIIQTDIQAQIREEIILQAKAKNQVVVEIPNWYFTKLEKNNDKFDLYHSFYMQNYYNIKKIIVEPINFNYAIIKTKKRILPYILPTDDFHVNLLCNDSYVFFDEPCLVFEFDKDLKVYDKTNYKLQFRLFFIREGKEQFVCIEKSIDDYTKIGNLLYYVVKLNNLGLQTIKRIDIVFNFKDPNKKSNAPFTVIFEHFEKNIL